MTMTKTSGLKLKSPLKWHGGKFYLRNWVMSHFPPRGGKTGWNLYREPFAGGLQVLFGLDPEGIGEAVNDKYKLLTQFWKCLQSPVMFERFQSYIARVPLSLVEWMEAEQFVTSERWRYLRPEEQAATLFVYCRQSRQGLMKSFMTPTTRLRRGMNENVSAWLGSIEGLQPIHERLLRVEVQNLDFEDFIRTYDGKRALFYCDPPYVIDSRSTGGGDYACEMSDEDHIRLLDCLSKIKGRFVLSGYQNSLYRSHPFLRKCRHVGRYIDNKASGKRKKDQKIECLWMNYKT